MGVSINKLQSIISEQGTEAYDTRSKCCENGWYDWFCSDSSLKNRTKKFFTLILGIKDGGKVDLNWEGWFKNNCPVHGPLYDDFRISSEDRNEFVICYKEPFKGACGKTWSVYTPDNGYEKPIALFDNVYQLLSWLNEK